MSASTTSFCESSKVVDKVGYSCPSGPLRPPRPHVRHRSADHGHYRLPGRVKADTVLHFHLVFLCCRFARGIVSRSVSLLESLFLVGCICDADIDNHGAQIQVCADTAAACCKWTNVSSRTYEWMNWRGGQDATPSERFPRQMPRGIITSPSRSHRSLLVYRPSIAPRCPTSECPHLTHPQLASYFQIFTCLHPIVARFTLHHPLTHSLTHPPPV